MSLSQTDEEIAAEALELISSGPQGREVAVKILDRALGRKMERYFVRHKVPADDAEELVWDVWLKLISSQFRGETRPIVWVWTVARSILISFHRKVSPEIGIDEEAWDRLLDTVHSPQVPAWVKLCIERALWQFEQDHPERAQILQMLAEEWSAKEIGSYLQCNEGAARDRVYRTRERAKEYLEECREAP